MNKKEFRSIIELITDNWLYYNVFFIFLKNLDMIMSFKQVEISEYKVWVEKIKYKNWESKLWFLMADKR